ncbi:MAG TPA: hypothetical protein VLC91_14455, partial [Spongiibacteraceae bacterium]|nr:hypothetical protein [Spongiibacteraceae bacterium]
GHPQQGSLSFLLLFLSLPLLLATSWPHYFVYLPFAETYLLISLVSIKQRWLALFALSLTICSIAFSSVFFFALFPNWLSYSAKGFLLLGNLVLTLAYHLYIIDWLLQSRGRVAIDSTLSAN